MSDTLQEREDQMSEHRVNQSGNCVISGCPCRGWSAQETVIPHHEFKPYGLYCQQCGADDTAPQHQIATITHQPAARGGGDERWEYGHYDGRTKGFYINNIPDIPSDYVRVADIRYHDDDDRDEAEARAHQIVTEHNQHQTLVAERERLITALQDCIQSLSRLPDVDGAYRVTTMKSAARTLAEIEIND